MSWPEPEKPLSVRTVAKLLEEDELLYYYNTETGEFYSTFGDDFLMSCYGDTEELIGEGEEDAPDLDAPGRIALPGSDEIEDLRWMRDFARSMPGQLGVWLLDAAYARHPYRSFKDEARRHDVLDAWWEYRELRLGEVARRWFERNGMVPAEYATGGEPPSIEEQK